MPRFIILVLLFPVLFICHSAPRKHKYELKQVFILGRHNIRAPFGGKLLKKLTNKPWPKWETEDGLLTKKGSLYEGYFGEYFSQWLKEEKLVTEECPKELFYIRANNKQRTIESARAFAEKAYPNCNLTVHYQPPNVDDLVFNVVTLNKTDVFREKATGEMIDFLSSIDTEEANAIVEKILDLKSSDLCKLEGVCSFQGKVMIDVKACTTPIVAGSPTNLQIAIEAMLMAAYQGYTQEDIPWVPLLDEDVMKNLGNVSSELRSVIFHVKSNANDIGRPLLQFMKNAFREEEPKVSLLVAHDANLNYILKALDVKPHTLKDHYEVIPPGSKLTFQKWYDEEYDRELLKVELIYQSIYQMRNNTHLSLSEPPSRKLLELNGCKADRNGYCSWDEFLDIMDEFVDEDIESCNIN